MAIRTTLYNPHTFAKEGDYVAYADYAALEAENASLRERIEQAPHAFLCGITRGLRCDCWKSVP